MGALMELDRAFVSGTYARFPIELVRGEGSKVYDTDGKEYIDMGSGIGVTAFGIADAEWKAAVCAQLDKLQHVSNLYYTEPCARLAALLCERTGMKKVFFGNSGAEANECAIKVARKYAAEKKGADHYTVVTLENSFHGRTLTTLAATGQEHFHKLFTPLTPGFIHTPANDLGALKKILDSEKVAGLLIECVQGEGGVIALDADFVKGAAALCKEKDIVFMVDEVQTGNGRTGALYSYMHFGVTPDVVTTAKGLGGGLPIGACLMGERVENILGAGDHGSTYGGNPIASAGAISVIERMDESFLASVREKSNYVFSALQGKKGIKSVSGKGLMIGIETEAAAAAVVKECISRGVLCLTAKSKVRLLPALNIPMCDLEKAVQTILAVAAELC